MPKDPLHLVDLTTARTEFEAEVIRHALESRGIPAHAFTLAGSALQWQVAAAQPMRVQVMRKDLERAHAALAEVRQESVDFDWSELEAEEIATVCPHCGYALTDLPDPRLCPECGTFRATGGVAGSRPRRMGRWRTVAYIALGAVLVLPVVIELLMILLGP
ncbi:MAG: hypothetical protein ACK4WH_05870 [Phycisphaerales bacterium]